MLVLQVCEKSRIQRLCWLAATLRTDKIDYTNDEDLLNFYERDEVATGWVNLHCYPGGTSWLGMITSRIPCFKPNDSCKHFELRGDYK